MNSGKSVIILESEKLQKTVKKLQDHLNTANKEKEDLAFTVKQLKKSSVAGPYMRVGTTVSSLGRATPTALQAACDQMVVNLTVSFQINQFI